MTPYPSFDATFTETQSDESVARRAEAERIQQQLNAAKENSQRAAEELNRLLVEGPFPMAYGMAEGTPHNARIQLRGEPSQPGDEVPRGFVQSIGGATLANDLAGSGRLELANWLTDAKNPLTSRVMVNRIWQYHFGRGLVRTPNDFGVRGLPPSHPELLDHLATRFIRQGWSIKAMHRMILLSRTYQLSSSPDISAHETSKETEWDDLYTHFVRRRLTAEEIRDSILAVCGDLDRTPGREHPFPSPITWGFSQHGPFSAVYDHNKRSVYLMTQRLKRHPFLALFDGPDPNASTADRLGTTVPTQALFFLNDPFVHARADAWAERLRTRGSDDPQRAEQAWLQAYGRRPSTDELKDAIEFLSVYRAELNAAEVDRVDQQALTALLRTLIGSNEFLHVD
jgi:hypothetical protein